MLTRITPNTDTFYAMTTSVRTNLIELIEPSDTLNHKPFFKHCILQKYFTHIFIAYICVEQNLWLKKIVLKKCFFVSESFIKDNKKTM